MAKVPADVALPVAVSCVAETYVVVREELPKKTCAPWTKLLPVMVREKLPRFVEAGEIPVRTGTGLRSETALVADWVVSAALVALMVTVFGVGSVAGAVYFPVESMVPRVEEPLAVPLTNHETEVLEEPVTVAEKVKESPARMLAVVGATEMATVFVVGGSGAGDFGVEEPLPPVAQPARSGKRQRRCGSRERMCG